MYFLDISIKFVYIFIIYKYRFRRFIQFCGCDCGGLYLGWVVVGVLYFFGWGYFGVLLIGGCWGGVFLNFGFSYIFC